MMTGSLWILWLSFRCFFGGAGRYERGLLASLVGAFGRYARGGLGVKSKTQTRFLLLSAQRAITDPRGLGSCQVCLLG